MRTLTKPSTAKCTLEHYTAFLLVEAQSAGCVRLSEVSGGEFAHDAANRFLKREAFSPKDLFEEMRSLIVLEEGVLSVDDTVLDKSYSQEGKTELVGYFWSGLHGKAVKGINLVTLFYGEIGGMRVPVNFRLVDKAEGKTKNDLFREMVEEVLGWGLAPAMVTADSWYFGVENLRFLRDQELSFMIALEKNRLVSEQRGEHIRQDLRTVRAGSLLDKGGHDGIGEVTFEAVPARDLSAPALEFQFYERAQAAEEMVADGLLAAHEEAFGVADLFEGAMITLDGPVLLMRMVEGGPRDFHALFFRGSKAA